MGWWLKIREGTRRNAVPGLDSLLTGIEPDSALSDRVAWLERLLSWVRRDIPSQRLRLILQILDHQPELRIRVAATLRSVLHETQALDLFAETGLPRAAGFFREAAGRVVRRVLPRPPITRDLADLFDRLFPDSEDAAWLAELDTGLVERIEALWQHERKEGEPAWETLRPDLEDALLLLAAWADNGFALLQLRPALAVSPPLQALVGPARAGRFAAWLDHNIAGLSGNITLGFLMGFVPQLAGFFGVPLEIRHVTLSTGQLAGALATLGLDSLGALSLAYLAL